MTVFENKNVMLIFWVECGKQVFSFEFASFQQIFSIIMYFIWVEFFFLLSNKNDITITKISMIMKVHWFYCFPLNLNSNFQFDWINKQFNSPADKQSFLNGKNGKQFYVLWIRNQIKLNACKGGSRERVCDIRKTNIPYVFLVFLSLCFIRCSAVVAEQPWMVTSLAAAHDENDTMKACLLLFATSMVFRVHTTRKHTEIVYIEICIPLKRHHNGIWCIFSCVWNCRPHIIC